MGCYQCLVAGSHVLAGKKAGLHKLVCRLCSAHGLHNDSDLRIPDDQTDIVHHQLLIGRARETAEVQDLRDADLLSQFFLKHCLIVFDHLIYTGTDGPASHNRDFDHNALLPQKNFDILDSLDRFHVLYHPGNVSGVFQGLHRH